MKNIIKKFKLIFLIFFLILLVSFLHHPVAEARSGCCSWHDGVCGCRCCDGTPLSNTCAPYYPSCNQTAHKNKDENGFLWIAGAGIAGAGIYAVNKFKKKS